MQRESDQQIVAMLRRHADLRGKQILEVGCGDGRITAGIQDLPSQLVAIDPDEIRIRQARLRLPKVDFRVGSGENLAFADQAFDRVLFTMSLHHQNGHRALPEAARVLRAEGRVIIVEPVNEGELEQVLSILEDETEATRQAQIAVQRSGLQLLHAEIFHSRWLFDDCEDLLNSLFDYYAMSFDRKLADQLTAALGAKREDRPIILADTLRLQILQKSSKRLSDV